MAPDGGEAEKAVRGGGQGPTWGGEGQEQVTMVKAVQEKELSGVGEALRDEFE